MLHTGQHLVRVGLHWPQKGSKGISRTMDTGHDVRYHRRRPLLSVCRDFREFKVRATHWDDFHISILRYIFERKEKRFENNKKVFLDYREPSRLDSL